jgi:hypothetical protein
MAHATPHTKTKNGNRKGKEIKMGKARALPEPEHRHPAVFPTWLFRPVSGLTSFGSSPSRGQPQWHIDEPALAYRCGGSTGISPVSRFTSSLDSDVGT